MAVQRAEALYNFEPTADVELQLRKGDVVTVHRTNVGEGWWEGELNGKRGLFPSSFVKMLPMSPQHGLGTLQVAGTITSTGTPRLSRKLCMDTLLAPCGVSSFSAEKAAEVFVYGREEINVMAGPKWDTSKVSPLTISVSYSNTDKQNEAKVFANYNVKTKELSSHVIRNYKHFLVMYDRFAEYFPCISVPPLPVKQIASSSDLAALETRRRQLEKFLTRVAKHPLLSATKVFYEFLTVNDEKIGKQQVKVTKTAKKIFQAPIYYVVQYPAYNIPVNQLSSIEKFCAFGELARNNFAHIHQSYQQHGMAESEVMSSLTYLGHDLKRLSKGLQPVVDAQHRKVQAMLSNSVSGDRVEESSDEGEESSWNWREDPKFSLLVHYLSDVGYGIQDVANVYRDHQERLDQCVVEGLAEYSNIFHTLPDMVKLHEEATEVFNASKEKDSKKEAEEVREHCDTLSNILMAEFDYISNTMTSDLQTITNKFLRLQADFHSKLASKWQSLYEKHRRSTDDQASVDGDLWNISRPTSFRSSSSPSPNHKVTTPPPSGDGEEACDGDMEREGEGGGRGVASTKGATKIPTEPFGLQEGGTRGEYEMPKVAMGKNGAVQEVDCSHYKNWQIALMLEKKKEGSDTPPSSANTSTSSLTKNLTLDPSKKPCPPPKTLKPSQDDYSVPWDLQAKLGPPPPNFPPPPPPAFSPPPPPPPPLPAQPPLHITTTAGLVHTYSKVTVAPDKPPPTTAAAAGTDNDKPSDHTPAITSHQKSLSKNPSRTSVAMGKKQPLMPPKKTMAYSRTASKDLVDDLSSEATTAPPTSAGRQDVAVTMIPVPSATAMAPPSPKPPHLVADVSSNKVKVKELLARQGTRNPKTDQLPPSSIAPAPNGSGDLAVRYQLENRDSSDSAVVVTYTSNGREEQSGEGGKSNLAKYGIVEDGGSIYTV